MDEKLSRRKFLYATGGAAASAALSGLAGREVAAQEGETTQESGTPQSELTPVVPGQVVYDGTFVSPLVEIFGEVFVGQGVFIAGNTILRAAPEVRVEVGNQTNAQDNITVRAREDSSTIGNETSLAHHAIVRDSEIGDFVFIGFNAEVVDSTVGNGAFILHGARVEGVTLAENAFVNVGEVVTDQATADALPAAEAATEEFRREVLDVNAEFAESYVDLFETEGYEAVIDVGPNPETSFNPRTEPTIGEGVELGEFVRIVGDVRLGDGSTVRQRTAIRADEGAPIVIGSGADIRNRVTFHALRDTEIQIGDNLFADDDAVIHGPLEVGDNLQVGERGVVFRASVGNDVTVGEGAIVAGPANEDGEFELEIPDGANIPGGAVVTDQEQLDAALEQQ